MSFLTELISKRGRMTATPAHMPVAMLERYGALPVPITAFAPDAGTSHTEYYYDTTLNALFRRIITAEEDGVKAAYWTKVSA